MTKFTKALLFRRVLLNTAAIVETSHADDIGCGVSRFAGRAVRSCEPAMIACPVHRLAIILAPGSSEISVILQKAQIPTCFEKPDCFNGAPKRVCE